jgi:hypothetical protein
VELLGLIGVLVGGPEVQGFIERSGETVDMCSIEGFHHLGLKSLGVCLSTEEPDTRIRTIHIHCEPSDGYSAYHGVLPLGLQPSFSSADVRALLGPPSQCSPALEVPILGPKGAWDRFDFAEYSVHLEYTLDGRATSLVTLMRAGTLPGQERDS